jgi:alpha-D-xyloside xylohydrolase
MGALALLILMLCFGCTLVPQGSRVTADASGLTIPLGDKVMRLEVFHDACIRVHTSLVGTVAGAAPSLVVIAQPLTSRHWTWEESGEVVTLRTAALRLEVNRAQGCVAFFDATGTRITAEACGSAHLAPMVVPGDTGLQVRQGFELAENEALYGLGQHQTDRLNRRDQVMELYQDNTRAYIPVLMSSRGYGILWDNYSYSQFEAKEQIQWTSELGNGIDYYFMYGPSLDSVIYQYRELTGGSPMLPRWALGLFQSRARYKTQAEILATVREYRRRQIPLDVIVQDWMYWPGTWGEKQFDSTRYPDPSGMMRTLHDSLDAHLMISLWPCLSKPNADYAAMETGGYLYPGTRSGEEAAADEGQGTDLKRFYNVYDATARDLFWQQTSQGLFRHGVDAWWTDCTEPMVRSWDTSTDDMRDMIRPGTGSGTRYLNTYSLQQAKGIYEGQRRETSAKRVFNLTRSAFAGQQRYGAATWSGDISANWTDLKRQVMAGLSFSLSGIPYWTHDIGGFFVNDKDWFRTGIFPEGNQDPAYHEFFVRWYQFGAFSPLFRVHGAQTEREIWFFGEPGDPAYDTQVKFDRLRYRLLPYLYSLAGQVTQRHYTPMRALVMDFPHDPAVWELGDQYMFGPALMVCPVMAPGVEQRSVYLPIHPGGWYDFWTGQHFEGGQRIETPAPLETMPIFVKAGSILPMGPEVQHSGEQLDAPWELRVYPGADGAFQLYEDENHGYGYEQGKYATVQLRYDEDSHQLHVDAREGTFPGLNPVRVYQVVWVDQGQGIGSGVSVGGTSLRFGGKAITLKQ